MIEEAVVSRVLGAALQTGGDFAEVFVEDKRSSSARARRRQGRGAHLGPRPRRRHPGRRGRHHRLRPHRRPHRGRPARRRRGGRRRGHGRRRRRQHRRAHPRSTRRAVRRSRSTPADVPKATQGRAAAPAPTRSPGRRAPPSPRCRRSYGDSRRRILVANSDGLLAERRPGAHAVLACRAWPPATPACRPAARAIGHTVGFELFDLYDVEELARRAAGRALTKLAARPAPSGQMPVVIGPGGGGVLFHEACGHGLEADLVAKGASVFTGRVGEQVAVAARHARRRRHHGRASGAASPSTTRATPPSATC